VIWAALLVLGTPGLLLAVLVICARLEELLER
jgi:hypothetical protein